MKRKDFLKTTRAEGLHDVAHLLISDDGINWQEQGDLKILTMHSEAWLYHSKK